MLCIGIRLREHSQAVFQNRVARLFRFYVNESICLNIQHEIHCTYAQMPIPRKSKWSQTLLVSKLADSYPPSDEGNEEARNPHDEVSENVLV